MPKIQTRRTLPLMGHPYEGVILILEIVSREQPTVDELGAKLKERQESGSKVPFYRNGDDDILIFAEKLLGLVEFNGDRLQLTAEGKRLHRMLYSEDFRLELFRLVLDSSRRKFTYFAQTVDSLEARAHLQEWKLQKPVYEAVLRETNKRSLKEIRSILEGCGIVRELGENIELNAYAFGKDADALDVHRLVERMRLILNQQGYVPFDLAMRELTAVCSPQRLSQLEPQLRARLRINATRTIEHVDGVLE